MTVLKREDLPLWMQKTLRGTDWGVLIVLGLQSAGGVAVPAATGAAAHQRQRALCLSRRRHRRRHSPKGGCIRAGRPTRSAATARRSRTIPARRGLCPGAARLLLTNDATSAVKLVYAAALCLAGTAVYAFVTRRSGAEAGVIAALLYVYSPYVGLDRAAPARRSARRDQPGADPGAALER